MNDNVLKIGIAKINTNEYSVTFRILVLIMLIMGVFISFQAAGINIILGFIVSGILSAGTYVSYRCKSKKNLPLKIVLACLMITFYFICLVELIGVICAASFIYLKLLLIEFLIGLLILHSFDSPKRSNMMTSVVSVIVMVGFCSGSSSENFWGVYLIAFIFISILVFIYNDLLTRGYDIIDASIWNLFRIIDLKDFSKIFVFVFLVTISLFLILPRFDLHNYSFGLRISKLITQSLPSSTGSILDSAFSNFNTTGSGSTSSNLYNEPILSVNNDQHKRKDNKLLMLIKSPKPEFTRLIALDYYTGQIWKLSGKNNYKTIYQSYPSTYHIPNELFTYRDSKTGDTITQVIYVQENQTTLISNAYYPYKVYISTDKLLMDSHNNIVSPVIISKGSIYAVYSYVPYYNQSFTSMLDTYTTSTDERNRFPQYLQVPEKLSTRTKELAKMITSKEQSDYKKAVAIDTYFSHNYIYDKDTNPYPKNKECVDYFLFTAKRGDSINFVTAEAIMLRSLKIPVRLVTGYHPGLFNPFTGMYEIRNNDFDTWIEIYNSTLPGWIPFYPKSTDCTRCKNVSTLESIINYLSSLPLFKFLAALIQFISSISLLILEYLKRMLFIDKLLELGNVGLIILISIILLLIFLVIGAAMHLNRKLSSKKSEVLSLYLTLCNKLKKSGLEKKDEETALEFLNRIKLSRQAEVLKNIDNIESITNMYNEMTFGKTLEQLSEMRDKLREFIQNRL